MDDGAGLREAIDFARFDALTFDCYGTLVDWESGLLQALRGALAGAAHADDDALLEGYARCERGAERPPYRTYRRVLAECVQGLAVDLGLTITDDAVSAFAESVRDWPVFPDTVEALRRLDGRFRLGVITNCDSDLFAASAAALGVDFDWVVTAELARAYKPSLQPFRVALDLVDVPPDRVLHVAQSLFHDHVPAKALGLTTVWIDRRHGRAGHGATPPATAAPDAVFPDLRSFAAAAVPDEAEPGARA